MQSSVSGKGGRAVPFWKELRLQMGEAEVSQGVARCLREHAGKNLNCLGHFDESGLSMLPTGALGLESCCLYSVLY